MKIYQDKEKLHELLKEYKTFLGVAKEIKVKPETISRWSKKFGIDSIGTQ